EKAVGASARRRPRIAPRHPWPNYRRSSQPQRTPPDTVSRGRNNSQAGYRTQPPRRSASLSIPAGVHSLHRPVERGPGMLTCYGDEVRLPQNDLAYVGFRLAVLDTLYQMETANEVDEGDKAPFGYLTEVPFLERVAPAVQVDLLAGVWA